MTTKFPLISYSVTCKYKYNSAGLKTLHEQVFTDEDFSVARQKAFEYVEAAQEFLHDDDVFVNAKVWKNPSGVFIRNKENFDEGIHLYMRINEDVNRYDVKETKDTKYLIASFCMLDGNLRDRIKLGRKKEFQFWNIVKQEMKFVDEFYRYFLHFEEQNDYLENLKKLPAEKIQYIPYDLENSIEAIYESISAFANTSGGTIIFGQDEKFQQYFSESKFSLLSENVCDKILEEYPEMEDYLILFNRSIRDRKFLTIEVVPTPFPCLYKKEYFTRSLHGNVLDLDKSYL